MRRAILICLLVALFPLAIIAGETAPTAMPSEVTLTTGRVLRNVSVLRRESDRVVLKHSAGADPVAFSLIAEPLRGQLPAIRKAMESSTTTRPASTETTRRLSGQVFVTTRGAGSYKFSGAAVSVYAGEHFDSALARQRSNLPLNYRRLRPNDQELAEADAWVKALKDTPIVASAKTDSDGKFELLVPVEGDLFIACFASRLLAGVTHEHNSWVVRVSRGETSLNLDGLNEWKQPD